MAKKSMVERDLKRRRLVARFANKRARLKTIIADLQSSPENRFTAQLKLAELPRNSSATRQRNRCFVTGRPRGYYRKFGLSRIALREMASQGVLPGVTTSSW